MTTTRAPRRSRAEGRRLRRGRHAVQAVLVLYVGWLVVGHAVGGEAGTSAEAVCPFGGFETAWTWITTGRTTAHVHTSNLVLAGAVVLLALAGRGFFCGWLCPLGTIQEWIHRTAHAVVRRIPPLHRATRRAAGHLGWLRPVDRVLRYGRYLVLVWAVAGTAIAGVLVFRDADPWNALLNVAEIQLGLASIVLVLMLVLSVVVERPWCRYACPLGAVQGLVGKASPTAVERDGSACNGCGRCTAACPMGIEVHARTRVTNAACIGCLDCVAACPRPAALGVTVSLPLRRPSTDLVTVRPADVSPVAERELVDA